MSTTMAKDVKISPENIFGSWGYLTSWSQGTNVAPDQWSMVGVAGSVAQDTINNKNGLYSMKITGGASSTYAAEHSILNSFGNYAGLTIIFGMYVTCSTANAARIYVKDGTQTVFSSYHPGDGSTQLLTVTIQISTVNTQLTIGAQVTGNGISAWFNGGVACQGEQLFTWLQAISNSNNTDTREVNISPSIKAELSTMDLARREGIYISNAKLGERDLKVSVQLWGNSYAQVRGYYDILVKAVSEGVKDFYIANDRIMKVVLSAISQIQYEADFQMYTVDIQFTAPSPYESSLGRIRVSGQQTGSSPLSFSVPYAGSYLSRPIINFVANAGMTITQCAIYNNTTAQGFSFVGSVYPGNTLTIDCEAQTVLNNGVDSISGFQGAFLKMVPGTNYLVFTGSCCLIQVDRLEKWL